MDDDPYDVLGVGPDATDEEVRAAYVEGMRRVHPDMEGGDEDAAKRLSAAYTTLHGGLGRARFDMGRRAETSRSLGNPPACGSCGPEPESGFTVKVDGGHLAFRDVYDLDGGLCESCSAAARRDLEDRHLALGPDPIAGIFSALGFSMAKRPDSG